MEPLPQSPLLPISEKAVTPDPERDMVEELTMSAAQAGYSEAIADVTGILVKVARMSEVQTILITLAKEFDTLSKKGSTHYARRS